MLGLAKALQNDNVLSLSTGGGGRPSYTKFTRCVLECKKRMHMILECAVQSSSALHKSAASRSLMATPGGSPQKPGKHSAFSASNPTPDKGVAGLQHHQHETDQAVSKFLQGSPGAAAAGGQRQYDQHPISPVSTRGQGNDSAMSSDIDSFLYR